MLCHSCAFRALCAEHAFCPMSLHWVGNPPRLGAHTGVYFAWVLQCNSVCHYQYACLHQLRLMQQSQDGVLQIYQLLDSLRECPLSTIP